MNCENTKIQTVDQINEKGVCPTAPSSRSWEYYSLPRCSVKWRPIKSNIVHLSDLIKHSQNVVQQQVTCSE